MYGFWGQILLRMTIGCYDCSLVFWRLQGCDCVEESIPLRIIMVHQCLICLESRYIIWICIRFFNRTHFQISHLNKWMFRIFFLYQNVMKEHEKFRMWMLCDVKSWLCACNQKLETSESKDIMGEVSKTHQAIQ